MIKTVLFDLDGVIIDSTKEIKYFWEAISQKFGIDISENDYPKHVFGCSVHHTIETIFPSLKSDQKDEVIRELDEYETKMNYNLTPGVLQVLVSLRKINTSIGLVTSSDNVKVKKILKEYDLNYYFKAIVTRDILTHSKPNPEGYLKAAQLLAVTPIHCLVFEDSISGVQAASNAGMNCIGVQSEFSISKNLFQAGAVSVIRNFSEISFVLMGDKVKMNINQNNFFFLASQNKPCNSQN